MNASKSICLIALIFFLAPTLVAQTTLKGTVVGAKGKPISKASVFLPKTYEGAETDAKGNFSFTTNEKGALLLVASHINHHPDTVRVEVTPEQTVVDHLTFFLYSQMEVLLDEVVVSSVSSMAVSETKAKNALSTLDVYTTPAANADLSMALRTTPGLQDVGNQEGFFIRGGANNETGVVIDGVTVKNFFSKGAPNIATRGRIDAGMFKGMVLGIGGYSPQYGNALSGILELQTNDMPKESSVGISLSPLFAAVQGGVFGLKRKTYTEASYSYSSSFAIQPFFRKGWRIDPWGDTHAFRMRNLTKLSDKGELRITLFADYSHRGIFKTSTRHDGGDFRFHNRERYLLSTVNYKHYLGSRMTLTLLGGYSRNENKTRFKNEQMVSPVVTQTVDEYMQAGGQLRYQQGRFSSLQGVDYHRSMLRLGERLFSDGTSSLFIHTIQQLAGSWLLTAGVRGEYSTFLKSGVVLPRLSLTYAVTKSHTLTLDGGSYAQLPNYFFPSLMLTNSYLPTGRERSEQYNLTYQFLPKSGGRVLRFQLFNKQYHQLTQLRDEALINHGQGYARGIDLFFMNSKSQHNFKYRLSYSYVDAKRQFLDYPLMVQPSFVANHTASVVLQKFLTKRNTQLNLSFSFNSGFPYYNPNLGDDQFMRERTAPRFDMNVSYNKLFTLGKATGVAVVSLTNILSSGAAYTYQFSQEPNSEGIYMRRAVGSPTYPFLFVGVFLNLGTDRRQEVIDRYL